MVGPHYTANLTLNEDSSESEKTTVGLLPTDKEDGLIIGAVVGSLLLLSLIVTLLAFIIRRQIHRDVPVILPTDNTPVKSQQSKPETLQPPATVATASPSLLTTTTTIGSSLGSNQLGQGLYLKPSHSYVDLGTHTRLNPLHGCIKNNSFQTTSSPAISSTILVTPQKWVTSMQETETKDNDGETVNSLNGSHFSLGSDANDLGRFGYGKYEERHEERQEIKDEQGDGKILQSPGTGTLTGNVARCRIPDICLYPDDVSLKENVSKILPEDETLSHKVVNNPYLNVKTNFKDKRGSGSDIQEGTFRNLNSDVEVGNTVNDRADNRNSPGSLFINEEGFKSTNNIFSCPNQKIENISNLDNLDLKDTIQYKEKEASDFINKNFTATIKNNVDAKILRLRKNSSKLNIPKTNSIASNSPKTNSQTISNQTTIGTSYKPQQTIPGILHVEPIFRKPSRQTEIICRCNPSRRRSSFPPPSLDKCCLPRPDLQISPAQTQDSSSISESISQSGSFKVAAMGLLQRFYNKESRYRTASDTSSNASHDKINNVLCRQTKFSPHPENANYASFCNLKEQNLGTANKTTAKGDNTFTNYKDTLDSSGIHMSAAGTISYSGKQKLQSCDDILEKSGSVTSTKSEGLVDDAVWVPGDEPCTPEVFPANSPMPSPRHFYYQKPSGPNHVHKTLFPFPLVPGKRRSTSQASSFPLASLRFDDSYLELHDNENDDVGKKSEFSQDVVDKHLDENGRNCIRGDEERSGDDHWMLNNTGEFVTQETENVQTCTRANASNSVVKGETIVSSEFQSEDAVMPKPNNQPKDGDISKLNIVTEQNQSYVLPTKVTQKHVCHDSKIPTDITHTSKNYTSGSTHYPDLQIRSPLFKIGSNTSKKDDYLGTQNNLNDNSPIKYCLPSAGGFDLVSETAVQTSSLDSYTDADINSVRVAMTTLPPSPRVDTGDTQHLHTNEQRRYLQDVHRRGFPVYNLCDLTSGVNTHPNIYCLGGTRKSPNHLTKLDTATQSGTPSNAAFQSVHQKHKNISDEMMRTSRKVDSISSMGKYLNETSSRQRHKAAFASKKTSIEQTRKSPIVSSSYTRSRSPRPPLFSVPVSLSPSGRKTTLYQRNSQEPENHIWHTSCQQDFPLYSTKTARPAHKRSQRRHYSLTSQYSHDFRISNSWLFNKECHRTSSRKGGNEIQVASNPPPLVFSRHMNKNRNRTEMNMRPHMNSSTL